MAPLDAKAKTSVGSDPYLDGWASISQSMEAGVSWSGHERNVAWLNAGDGTFVEASGPVGFDAVEDGRVVCRTDWDRDGDVDLWLRSRNGLTLRYLENQSNPSSFIELTGLGRRTRVTATLESGESRVFAAALTDGYLSAPSQRLTIAVPEGVRFSAFEGVTLPPMAQGNAPLRFELSEDALMDRSASFEARPALVGLNELEQPALPTRTVLRSGVPIPPRRLDELGVPHESEPNRPVARLLVVRSSDCPTCESVLPGALGVLASEETVGEAAVEIVNFPVSLDLESQDSSHEDAAKVLRSIVASVLGPGAELALPLSILTDGNGIAQVIYQADLDPVIVSQDAAKFVLEPVQGALRAAWGVSGAGSRWFHGSPRSYASLRSSLEAQGLQEDADFFAAYSTSKR